MIDENDSFEVNSAYIPNPILGIYQKGELYYKLFSPRAISNKRSNEFLTRTNSNFSNNHFYSDENEHKENLILVYNELAKKKFLTSTGIFLVYNLAKEVLWRKGYFAYFFFHTKYMSPIFLFTMYYFIYKEWEFLLRKDNLFRYYLKRQNTLFSINQNDLLYTREKVLLDKMDEI